MKDTAITLALAFGLDGARAMRLVNAAPGVVVIEPRAATCPLDLRSALASAPSPQLGEPLRV